MTTELEIYRKTLDSIAHVLETDADGTITYVNDKVCKLSKYSREELIGQNNRIFNSNYHSPDFYKNMFSELAKGNSFNAKFKNKAKDGTYFWLDAIIIPFLNENKQPYKYLTIRFDITDKINELNLKEEFLANISHELRTPLHGLLSIVDLLKETPLNISQIDYLKHIKESANHVYQLVNDLLDLYKTDSGKLKFESIPFNISNITKSLIDIFRIRAINKGIVFNYTIDKNVCNIVLGDPTRLKQILYNLLENAYKYTVKGTITLDIKLANDTAEKQLIEFNIIDTGKGISKEKQEEIFEKYIQSDVKDTRLYGGTGLGLNIVKNLIVLQEGSLSLNSNDGTGTTFTFSIPYKKITLAIDPAETIIKSTNSHNTQQYTILIVDDDKINRMIFEKQMLKFNYNYTLAENGFDALQILQQKHVDLIVLDMQMPGMNGDEVIKKIRNEFDEPLKNIPIICVSATIQPKTIQTIIDAGANGHLLKPYKENKLAEIIQNTLTETYTSSNVINLKTLNQFADGDTNFILELLDYFTSTTPDLLKSMQINFTTNKIELAAQLHKYRSQVSLLGFTELTKLTKSLELALLEHAPDLNLQEVFNSILILSTDAIINVNATINQLKKNYYENINY